MINLLASISSLLFIVVLIGSIRKPYGIPILPMFLITFGMVIMSRPMIGAIIPDFDITFGTWIYWGFAPEQYVVQSLALICLFLLATVSTMFIMRNDDLRAPPLVTNRPLMQVAVFFLCASAPLYVYRGWLLWTGVQDSGYLATFTGDVKAPFFVNISTALFKTSYYFFLASFPGRRMFYTVSSLFLLLTVTSVGTGQRTELVTGVLFFFWATYNYSHNQFSFKKIIPVGLGLIILSIAINAMRFGDSPLEAIQLGLLEFAWGQGISFFTIIGTLENTNSFHLFEGFFFPNKLISCDVLPYITGQYCNNSDVVTNTLGIWWQKLTYILDPIKFYEGGGLGGSIISALYLMFNFDEFPLAATMFFLSSLAFWFVVIKMHRMLSMGVLTRVFGLYLLHMVIFIPRGGLDIFIPHPRYIGSAILIYFVYRLVAPSGKVRHVTSTVHPSPVGR